MTLHQNMNYPPPIPAKPGQESVWDYPRPPRLELTSRHILVMHDNVTLAETQRAFRVLERSHPPVYYLPPQDVRLDLLLRTEQVSFCEWKGAASYYHLATSPHRITDAAWSYDDPATKFREITGYIAFYPAKVEAFVDGERVQPQPGNFYGGWITSDIVGPFKGEPGSRWW